jgi:hypothetical protein
MTTLFRLLRRLFGHEEVYGPWRISPETRQKMILLHVGNATLGERR